MSPTDSVGWILLVLSLPSRSATARMRVWRALRGIGAAVLRDGVYLLPDSAAGRRALAEQAQAVRAARGSAHLLGLAGVTPEQEAEFRALFDRSAEYLPLVEALRRLRTAAGRRAARSVAGQMARLRRRYEAIRATDHFPGPAAEQAAQLLAETEALLGPHAASDEPRRRAGAIAPRDRAEYQGRVWATRARPWVDRLESGRLIRRFIDPQARFQWLGDPGDCPAQALGFDFDGAEFSHVGARVTFETLLASFGLEGDAALARVGDLVHYLDVGGAPPPEAAGLAAVLRGARARHADDDRLLTEAGRVFDDLYQTFREDEKENSDVRA